MKLSLKWLWLYSSGFRIKLLVIILLNIGGVFFSLAFVESTKIFINDAITGKNIIFFVAVTLIGLKTAQLLCEQGEIYIRTLSRAQFENNLEYKMFCFLTNSQIQAKQKFHSGDEIYRLSSDVGIVAESIIYTFPILVYSVIQLIATWGYLMTMQPILTIFIGLISPIIIFAGYYYTRLLVPISRNVRLEGSRVNKYIQEHLQHHELISIMQQNKYVQNQVAKLQDSFFKVLKSKIRLTIGTDSLTEIGFALSYLTVFIWGINGLSNKTISYGDFLVFIQLVGQLQRPVFIFKEQYPSWIASFASVERLMEITSLLQEKQSNNNQFIDECPGLRFNNIYFKYPQNERWILENFTYNFSPGSITAILGETGAGKSTIIRLALGILVPQRGDISIYSDKENIEYKVGASTRCNCIYVPQGNSIISGTIKYNLLLGNTNATEYQMKEALYLSSAEFVMKDFPDGLDTVVGERGIGLSEGQAQRIAIARALLKKGGLLLLDEPTSALDSETEKRFLDRLIKKTKNKTVIIITHKQEICEYVSNAITICKNNK